MRLEPEKNGQSAMRKLAPVYQKLFKNLFYLYIPILLADFMTNEMVAGWIPALYLPGLLLSIFCPVCYYIVLLRQGDMESNYRIAGLLGLGSILCGVLVVIFAGMAAPLATICSGGSTACGILFEYFEYKGHETVVSLADRILAERWRKLFYLYFGLFVLVFLGATVAPSVPLLGVIAVYAGLGGTIILQFIKLIYLHSASTAFANAMLRR